MAAFPDCRLESISIGLNRHQHPCIPDFRRSNSFYMALLFRSVGSDFVTLYMLAPALAHPTRSIENMVLILTKPSARRLV